MVKVQNGSARFIRFVQAADTTLAPQLTEQLTAIGVQAPSSLPMLLFLTGLDIIVDYNKKWGHRGIKLLLAGNFQHMTVDEVHVPPLLNDSYKHRKTFFSDP